MTPQEIYSQFLKPYQKILHLGCGDKTLQNLCNPDKYVGLSINECNDITTLKNLDNDFDYVVIDEVLELINSPTELIENSKTLGKTIFIWEIKYDFYEPIDKDWKQPWKKIPLGKIVEDNFDFVNQIFLGYATMHFCSFPIQNKEEI